MNQPPSSILAQFFPDQSPPHISPLGNGLINDTYLLRFPERRWVLQRINRHVFPHPEKIIHNLIRLEAHLEKHPAWLKIPSLLPDCNGRYLAYDQQQNPWRVMEFIEDSESRETITSLAEAASVGEALAQFHRQFHRLDVNELEDSLPGFHQTPLYLKQYDQTVARQHSIQSNPKAVFCREFIEQCRNKANTLEDARQQGLIKARVTHGDPKLNNFLFNRNSTQVVALIDLDTVKPNLIQYDIADCIRSCCRTETQQLNLPLAKLLLQHYLQAAQSLLSPADIEFICPALELLPFELGLRFYTDYLSGNHYFKTDYPEQNLDRARHQFLFCSSLQRHQPALTTFIQSLCS